MFCAAYRLRHEGRKLERDVAALLRQVGRGFFRMSRSILSSATSLRSLAISASPAGCIRKPQVNGSRDLSLQAPALQWH